MEKNKMILGFDSAGKSVSAAVYDEKNDICLANRFLKGAGTHSVTLLPIIDEVLNEAGVKISELSAIAVTVGPGSFTGVRIGVSLAKGLSVPANIPVSPVSALFAAALSAEKDANEGDAVLAVSDARRERFYNALFVKKEGTLLRLTEDSVLHYTEICELVYQNKIIIAGDGAEFFKSLVKDERFFLSDTPYTDAEFVCKAAKDAERICSDGLLPIYLGLSQAERELKEKSAK